MPITMVDDKPLCRFPVGTPSSESDLTPESGDDAFLGNHAIFFRINLKKNLRIWWYGGLYGVEDDE